MTDKNNNVFHEFALQSSLFKGRSNLYFSYLKSERLAHALVRIFSTPERETQNVFETLVKKAVLLPQIVVNVALGDLSDNAGLAVIFELLSLTRLAASSGFLNEHNAAVLIEEYESLAQKISSVRTVSILSREDFALPEISSRALAGELSQNSTAIKDTMSLRMSDTSVIGQNVSTVAQDKGQNILQNARFSSIIKVIERSERPSIKDISKHVRGCSEKTIQRDLNVLIQQGLVRKEGQKRWSVYLKV